MVIERFLSWVAAAPAQSRIGAARSLVAAYGRPETEIVKRHHLDRMIAVLLDDPVISVRCALAEAASISSDVPRHVVVALSRDCAAVSVPVLQSSKSLSADDLLAAIALGDDAVLQAIASRVTVPAAVTQALAADAPLPVIETLCRNPSADLTTASLRRILQRFAAEACIREAILDRENLDPAVQHEIVVATAKLLTDWATSRGLMSPRRAECVVSETTEKAIVTIAAGPHGSEADPAAFVAYLRSEGRLTPAVLLRSLLSGQTGLFEATLEQLAGVAAGRAAGMVRTPTSLAFASLYARAAMPPTLLPLFRAAVAACLRCEPQGGRDAPVVRHEAVAAVRTALARGAELPGLTALLYRLEAEALRDDARRRRRVAQAGPQLVARNDVPVFAMRSRPVFRLPFRSAA